MPRPCAVEVHVRRYKRRLAGVCGCHGLAPWRFTFAATRTSGYKERLAGRLRMPRPCAVELHVRGYKRRLAGVCGCHGLAPWRFTFAATKTSGYKERLAGV